MTDRASIFYAVARIPQGGGEASPVDLTDRVIDFTYEDREKGSDRLKLTVDNFDLIQFDDPLFETGQFLQVTWGVGASLAPTHKMVIKKVTGARQLTVEAHHKSVVMDSLRKRRKFENVTRSAVVRQIATEYRFGHPDIEDTTEVFEEIAQSNLTDAQFLRKLAHLEGFQFYLDAEGMHWHERRFDLAPRREYFYYRNPDAEGEILDFSIENDVTRRPGRVKVKSRDPLTKKEIEASASNSEDPDRVVLMGATGVKASYQYVDQQGSAYPYDEIAEGVYVSVDPSGAPVTADTEDIEGSSVFVGNTQNFDAVNAPPQTFINDAGFEETVPTGGDLLQSPESLAVDEAAAEAQTRIEQAARESTAAAAEAANNQSGYLNNFPDGQSYEEEYASNVQTEDDAKREAKKRYRLKSQGAVKMTLTLRGDPQFAAKTIIKISGMGKRISGKYYVKSVTHKLSSTSGYTMEASLITDGFQSKGKKKSAGDGGQLDDLAQKLRDSALEDISTAVGPQGDLGASDAALQGLFSQSKTIAATVAGLSKKQGEDRKQGMLSTIPLVDKFGAAAAGAGAKASARSAAQLSALLRRLAEESTETLAEGKLNTKEVDTTEVAPVEVTDAEGNTQTRYENSSGGRAPDAPEQAFASFDNTLNNL